MMVAHDLADDEHVAHAMPDGPVGRLLVPRPLRGYRRAWLRGDVLAGLTVAALVVPLGLAFAELAGLPAVYGLYTSIVPVVVFGLVASSPQAIVGAEAALSGIVAAAIAPAVATGHEPVHAAAALTLMIGAVSLVGALARVGRLAQLVSRTVFVGYMAGVAVSVIVSQVPRLIGAPAWTASTLAGQLVDLPRVIGAASPASAVIGVGTFGAVIAGRHLVPRWPIALIMLVVTAAASAALGLSVHDVALVGILPSGLPGLVAPSLHLDDLWGMLPAAIAIAIVGFADTTVVAQGFAARNGYRVNSSRDLAALGAADLASGALGGLPVSASSARTAVAEASGAHSQVAPMVSALAIAAILLGLADLVRWIPQPALAGVIAAVMVGIVDIDSTRRLVRGRRTELTVCIAAFAGVALVGVLEGVLIAVAISIAAVALRTSRPHDAVLGRVAGDPVLHPMDEHEAARTVPGVLVYRFDAPLFFGNVDRLRSRILDAVAGSRGDDAIRNVVIVGTAITDVDFTACRVLEEVATSLARQGVTLSISGLNHEVVDLLRRDGVLAVLGADALVDEVEQAPGVAGADTAPST